MDIRKQNLENVESIVIKLGTRTLLAGIEGDGSVIKKFASDIAQLKKSGKKITIISSGAVGFGMKKLNLTERPSEIYKVQALASIGQNDLMKMWSKLLGEYNINIGQVLLTNDIFEDRKRFLLARDCIKSLLEFDTIPIINENDTVSIDELQFGDNDCLSALCTQLCDADLLVLYTDTDGIYTANPKKDSSAKRIPIIDKIDEGIYSYIKDDKNSLSKGGMTSKIDSASLCAINGVSTVIAHGEHSSILDILRGKDIGTFVIGTKTKKSAKQRWILFNKRTHGKIFVDDGAEKALKTKTKSLLATGIIAVEGKFDQNEIVEICDKDGKKIARGITYFSSEEVDKIKGLKSGKIQQVLGYKSYDEVINKDNLIV